MASEVEICSMAFVLLGDDPIEAFGDDALDPIFDLLEAWYDPLQWPNHVTDVRFRRVVHQSPCLFDLRSTHTFDASAYKHGMLGHAVEFAHVTVEPALHRQGMSDLL